jgi:serine/threonine-protein kinase
MDATRPGLSLPERYAVMHHIANGGMASVYAARDTRLDRVVAVKVLAPAYAADADARRRFTREARAAARLSMHPHIVAVYDAGEHDSTAYIVMALYPGGTVGQRLRQGPIAQDLALHWLEHAASGLDHAHAQGVVHRDVKPGNLLLDEHDRLAVGDFGIATAAWEASVTQAGMVLGTMAYLSPEQRAGQRATAASDRYALAVVAHELLAGRRPTADPATNAGPWRRRWRRSSTRDGRGPGPAARLVRRARRPAGDRGGRGGRRRDGRHAGHPRPCPPRRPRPRPRRRRPRRVPAAAGRRRGGPPHADADAPSAARTPAAAPPTAARAERPPAGRPPGPPAGPPGDGRRSGRGGKALVALAALALVVGIAAALLSGLGSSDDSGRRAQTPSTVTDGGAAAREEEPAATEEEAASTATEEAEPPAATEEVPAPAPEAQPEAEAPATPAEPSAGAGDEGAAADGNASGNAGGGNASSGGGTGSGGGGSRASGGSGSGAGASASGARLSTSQAAALNDQGYRRMRAGDPAGAVPDLRRAVDGLCRNESDIRCAFALYNLGRSLRLSGNPAEAVPVLERRLQVNDTNQPGVVRRELELARQQAGQG